nr:MAG TPA: hypothetical protein [Caudoviricetes sp.]
MQLTSSAVSCIEYTAREWDIHDTAYMAGYRAAREDAAEEDKQKAKIRGLKQSIKRQRRLCTIKQKVTGLIFIAIGCLLPVILDGDAAVSMLLISILLIPMGLYITFTKELVLYDSDVEKLRELKRELREEREVARW